MSFDCVNSAGSKNRFVGFIFLTGRSPCNWNSNFSWNGHSGGRQPHTKDNSAAYSRQALPKQDKGVPTECRGKNWLAVSSAIAFPGPLRLPYSGAHAARLRALSSLHLITPSSQPAERNSFLLSLPPISHPRHSRFVAAGRAREKIDRKGMNAKIPI